MTVNITHKHCEGAIWSSNTDCPLFRAIKEQYPDFPLAFTYSTDVETTTGRIIKFQTQKEYMTDGWNIVKMNELLKNEKLIFIINLPWT